MKRSLLFLLLILIPGISSSQATGFVRLEGRQFKDENGNDFYPVVCNYWVRYVFNTTGNLSNTFIAPCMDYDNLWTYESADVNASYQQIRRHFDQIADMGFNAIRLFGTQPLYVDTAGGIPGFRIDAHDLVAHNTYQPLSMNSFFPDLTNINDPVCAKIFSSMGAVIQQAHDAGLKVILLSGQAHYSFSPDFAADYVTYLGYLSQHFSNPALSQEIRKAILAFDLFNEPLWSKQVRWPYETVGHSKQDICNYVASWYDAIRSNDPNHLITLGGSNYDDIYEYDLSVMKLDFYSAHFYPLFMPYEASSYASMLKRAQVQIDWLNRNCPMPWIIGETGFTAAAGFSYPVTNGTLAEQLDYVEQTIDMVRNCGGSGYSLWIYQEMHWDLAGSVTEGNNFFGLLAPGLCDPVPCTTLEKPVVNAIRTYLDPVTHQPPAVGSCTVLTPAEYYNPLNHPSNNNTIHGTVLDQYGSPVEDAVVYGWTLLWEDQFYPFIKLFDHHFTFTNSTGEFDLIPFDYETSQVNSNMIEDIAISAVGSERAQRGWMGGPIDTSSNGETFYFNQNKFGYDNYLTNISLTSSNQHNLQGWNSLVTENISILPGVSSEISARTSVGIKSDFHAISGSEVHIFNTETHPECISYSGYTREMPPEIDIPGTGNRNVLIEIDFLSYNGEFNFEIAPNPNTGQFSINLNGFSTTDYEYHLYNNFGSLIISGKLNFQKTQISLPHLSKGSYLLKVNHEEQSAHKLLLIQ